MRVSEVNLYGGLALVAIGGSLLYRHFTGGGNVLPFGGRRVISLNTQQRPIDTSDVIKVTRQLDHWTTREPEQPVAMMIHTGGGFFGPSIQITRAVKRHGNVWAFVPYYALSGGTLIALGCRNIVMTPAAHLGPVDPQVCGFSASSLISIVNNKSADSVEDHTHAIVDEARKAVDAMERVVREIAPASAVDRLVAGRLPHSFPITRNEAIALGLPVQSVDNAAHLNALVERLALSEPAK